MLSRDVKKDWLDTLGQEQKKLELQCKDLEQTTRTLQQRIEELNFVVEWYANKDADVEEEAKKELKTTKRALEKAEKKKQEKDRRLKFVRALRERIEMKHGDL